MKAKLGNVDSKKLTSQRMYKDDVNVSSLVVRSLVARC